MIISFLNSNQVIFHQKIFIANVSTTVLWSSSEHCGRNVSNVSKRYLVGIEKTYNHEY